MLTIIKLLTNLIKLNNLNFAKTIILTNGGRCNEVSRGNW